MSIHLANTKYRWPVRHIFLASSDGLGRLFKGQTFLPSVLSIRLALTVDNADLNEQNQQTKQTNLHS